MHLAAGKSTPGQRRQAAPGASGSQARQAAGQFNLTMTDDHSHRKVFLAVCMAPPGAIVETPLDPHLSGLVGAGSYEAVPTAALVVHTGICKSGPNRCTSGAAQVIQVVKRSHRCTSGAQVFVKAVPTAALVVYTGICKSGPHSCSYAYRWPWTPHLPGWARRQNHLVAVHNNAGH